MRLRIRWRRWEIYRVLLENLKKELEGEKEKLRNFEKENPTGSRKELDDAKEKIKKWEKEMENEIKEKILELKSANDLIMKCKKKKIDGFQNSIGENKGNEESWKKERSFTRKNNFWSKDEN